MDALSTAIPGHRFDVVSRMASGGHALLDVGCGNGFLAVLVGGRYREIHGVDHNQAALCEAEIKGVCTYFVELDEPLPLPNDYFDTVACLEVLEHVRDPRRLMVEIARVLKPGGEAFISSPNIRFVRHLQSLVVAGQFPVTSGQRAEFRGGHLHHFTHRDIDDLVAAAGLRVTHRVGLTSARVRQRTWWRLLVALLGRGFEREFLCVGLLVRCVKALQEVCYVYQTNE